MMKLKTQYHWGLLVFTAFIFFSCSSDNKLHTVDKIKPEVLAKPQLFIDFEQNGMVQPSSIEMLGKSRIAVLDSKLNEVLVFNDHGAFEFRFGGKGKGPGEFSRPQYIDQSRASINVIDAELQRVNQFNYSGDFERSFTFEENPYDGKMAVMGVGKYFVGAIGANGSLIKLVDTTKDTVNYFGEALGEENPPQRLEIARQTLAGGEIPGMYKNQVTLYLDGKHLYVFLEAYSRIQKYSIDGRLLWETAVDLPVNKLIFQKAVERAKKAPTDVLPSYRYITSMKVVDGRVFLLWMPVEDHPRKLVRINKNGEITTIYHVPEKEPTFFDFAIDSSDNKLYLSAPQIGQVYQTNLEI
ncbi:6-bladed beta-propeller [Aliifodinibius salicampi]|uniref:6-bladed beta-propeller n=1 Tax=Fodinibius salicampi TaxID=1920655 RepID=A0ABT3Q3A5_9BACT|nr:6-bladed beta-propeller [Fodinibius salicampi]MCW9714595.1 6-bladed beta-propeller [Fodinibius salicampi]